MIFKKIKLESHIEVLYKDSIFVKFDHLRIVVVNDGASARDQDLVGHVRREELDEVVCVSLDQDPVMSEMRILHSFAITS